MVSTKVTNSDIKTNENVTTAYRNLLSGGLDTNNSTSEENRNDEKKQLRESVIKSIMERYPMDFDEYTNYNRFTDHELTSILKYGDHRAEVDPDFIDIDYSPTYSTDSSGRNVISHNKIDLEYKDRFEKEITIKLGGFGMFHRIRSSKTKDKDSTHHGRMSEYSRLLKNLPIKFGRATQFLLDDKLENVAKASMSYYSRKSRKFLASVIIELMRSYDDEHSANIRIEEICQELNVDTRGIIGLRQDAVEKLDFLKTLSSGVNRITLKKQKIKRTAQTLVYQLAQEGFVYKPSILNRFIEEIDNHYSNIFYMKKKPEQVIAILTAKLFDEELSIREMSVSLNDGGYTDLDANNAKMLTKQVVSWVRNNDNKIGNDVISGRIRDLYITEIEEVLVPQEIEIEVTTNNTSVVLYGRPANPPRPKFQFSYNQSNDSIVTMQNDLDLLNYLTENNLLDQINYEKSSYKSNSILVDIPTEPGYHGAHYNFYDIHNSQTFLHPDYQISKKQRLVGTVNLSPSNSSTDVASKPGINQISNSDITYNDNSYCYLGYPGAITRLLSLLSIRNLDNANSNPHRNTIDEISTTSSSYERQNPSIMWLVDKKTFFERADQVMMKRDGLFGKWKDYIEKYNIKFLDDLDHRIETLNQLGKTLDQLLESGSVGNTRLGRNSVVIFPDLRRLLYNELESSVLRMSPNDFVRMKQDQYNLKIEDLELAKKEKITAYRDSINRESVSGIYKGMRTNDIQQLLNDFSDAQHIGFEKAKGTLRYRMKSDIDEFIDCKHRLGEFKRDSEGYREIQQSMFKNGILMSEEVKYFYSHMQSVIDQIKKRHGITLLLGGILSADIKTSQLLKDNTLHIDGILENTPDHIIDQHMIKLCYTEFEMDNDKLEVASVVTTNIPDKLSISSYKLSSKEFGQDGLHGKWHVDKSFNLKKIVEWVN